MLTMLSISSSSAACVELVLYRRLNEANLLLTSSKDIQVRLRQI